jgi:hypothetical protein
MADRVSVFEAINETLQEFYVGISPLPGDANLAGTLPTLIPHWKTGHKTACRFVASEMERAAAGQYVQSHAKSLARTGWKVLTESPGRA